MHPFLIFLLIAATAIVAVHPLTVLLHELGHAVPALLLTRRKVNVYLGSYGDPAHSFHLRLGRLHLWLRRSFFWTTGLCAQEGQGDVSLRRQWIIVLCGPLASLLVAIGAGCIIFGFDFHGGLKFICVMFGVSAIWDLVRNLVPNPEPVRLHDGTQAYNDGMQLAQLRYWRRMPDGFMEAMRWYEQREYGKTAARLLGYMERGAQHEVLHRMAVAALYSDHQFAAALQHAETFRALYTSKPEDEGLYASALLHNGRQEEGLALYEGLAAAHPGNLHLLHNYAYYLSFCGDYEKAFPLLDHVIQKGATLGKSATLDYAYNNRGLCHLMLGRPEEAYADMLRSRELDPANAYVYRNLGIWHLRAGAASEALPLLEKAKAMSPRIDGLDALLEEAACAAL